jgi:hypothetical protein
MTATDPIADAALFDVEAAPPVTLADRFTMPPFSVLDRKQGAWLDRRRRWLSLGIESEVGRGKGLVYGDAKFTAATMGSPEQRSLPRDEPSLIEGHKRRHQRIRPSHLRVGVPLVLYTGKHRTGPLLWR